MTAPGNSALLFTLMAVFVACCGYAAGRMHQRYQMEQDREEAYRDGYDTATRSIFSLAARLIAPRRGVRGSAPVQPVLDGALVAERSVLSASPSSSPSSSSPSPFSPSLSPAEPTVPVAAALPGSADLPSSTAPNLPPALLRRSAAPGSSPAAPSSPSSPPAPEPAASMGFPVPPPPSSHIVGEPPAVGGLTYRTFPDPRPPADAEPQPSAPASNGRHTVPDELVQAATYRLPPDRVFRAKIPDADGPGLPEEPTTRLSVPKPRQS
ncbi:hypothetical protein ACQP2F_37175 [Actinoplanes sp. CA-030573]|uniref:hypothetical protein n=1 Tax=Actinoplanes sp. CA-030573 TaxID=3239898 RepID=UPI003D8E5A66